MLVAPEAGDVELFEHLDRVESWKATAATSELSATQFQALVLPGGVANADQLRTDPAAVDFVRETMARRNPVAVICHGPWILVEADGVRGRTLTSWPSLQTDIINAGGSWADREVCVDGNLISSRKPADLPAFCQAMVTRFAVR